MKILQFKESNMGMGMEIGAQHFRTECFLSNAGRIHINRRHGQMNKLPTEQETVGSSPTGVIYVIASIYKI